MSQQLETEFKNMISRLEYQRLLDHFDRQATDAIIQTNYYFDTPDFELREARIGLRLRLTDHYRHLTLKQPSGKNQMIEITDKLTHNEAQAVITDGAMPEAPAIRAELAKHQLSLDNVSRFAAFETRRIETEIPNSTLVFDECHFDHYTDYELEMETTLEPADGEQQFLDLLKQHHIPIRPSEKKMIRMQRTEPLYPLDEEGGQSHG